MNVVKKNVPKQKETDQKPTQQKPLPKINLSELTDAQLLTVIFQQQDTVGRMRQQLAQEEQKLRVIEAEGRKRAKPIEEAKEEKLK